MAPEYDIIIVGGGLAGLSLAYALKGLPLSVAVVEAVPPGDPNQPSFDARALALAYGSRRIFEGMGLWSAIEREGATPIQRIHISERGSFGATRLTAAEEGVPALGYVAESRALGVVLAEAQQGLPDCRLIAPAWVKAVAPDDSGVTVTVESNDLELDLRGRLLVAADGGRSRVRELMQARSFRAGYRQTAVIATVTTDRPHQFTAYERFTESGPTALLPCERAGEATGRRWSLVWTVRNGDDAELLDLPDATFLQRLGERFGRRAGRFESVTGRHAYPLGLEYVRDVVLPRVALVGNAAHAIHPVAGQGFNLGLRDVAALAEVLAEAVHSGADIGAPETLHRYSAWRRPDYLRVMGFTDTLARAFVTPLPGLATVRHLGLTLLDALPAAKHLLARQSMGLTGRLPRLACGIPLIDG